MRDTFVESHPFAKCAKGWGTLGEILRGTAFELALRSPKPLPGNGWMDKMGAALDVRNKKFWATEIPQLGSYLSLEIP
jgi:hypothetical protein